MLYMTIPSVWASSKSWTFKVPVSQNKTPTPYVKKDQNIIYINDKIKAFRILVLDEDWGVLWEMSRDEALTIASEQNLDLVQISYNPIDKVSTAKIVDYGRYMYDKKRTQKDKKKNQNKWMKQIKCWYWIWDNDLQMKLKKIEEMLLDWYMVRIVFQLKGRENIYKDKVVEKLKFMQESLVVYGKSQFPNPKIEKNTVSISLSPVKK